MASALYTIIILAPMVAWAVANGWSPSPSEGEPLLDVPITLMSRLKMLILPTIVSVFLGTAFFIADQIPVKVLGAVFLALVVLLSVPMSYHLTTAGIRTGRGQFRRWTEFAGVSRSASGAVMRGVQGTRGYPIFLSGDRSDDEFVSTLKSLVRDSYKGKGDAEAALRSRRAGKR